MTTATAHSVTYGLDASIAKFSVPRYQRMIESGIVTSEDRVELLENYVVLKMPGNPLHDGTIQLIGKRVGKRVPTGWDMRVQLSVTLADSQPEPDFAICRGDETSYLMRHPVPADIGLIIEVANSSLLRDQRDKTRIYARAAIPIYWIINLVDRRIEVYTQPSGPIEVPVYSAFQTYQPGDQIPLVLDSVTATTIPVVDLLP